MVQSKGATVENPPCEIIQQQSQQTISNQIKAHRVKIEKNKGGLVNQLESAWFENMWLGRESETIAMRFDRKTKQKAWFEAVHRNAEWKADVGTLLS